VDADGNWSTGSNWTGGTDPNGAGAVAHFGSAISAPHTVTLDATRTVNTINFDNTFSYTIAGANTLHLDAVTGSPLINNINGSHTISAPIQLDKTTDVVVANGGEYLSARKVFCNADGCLTRIGDDPANLTTWDYGHLTTVAARYLASRLADDTGDFGLAR